MNEIVDVFARSPQWLKYFVYAIAGLAAVVIVYYGVVVSRISSLVDELIRSLALLGSTGDDERATGRTQAAIDAWRANATQISPRASRLRNSIDRHLVALTDAKGDRHYKLKDTGFDTITEEALVHSTASLRMLDSAPALLTGLGLLGTFLAIALGLSGVYTDQATQRVEGISGLLGGLSGKFVTSIVAILVAIIVQALDSAFIRPKLSKHHRRLADAIEDALPTVSVGQQLSELLTSSRKQERSLANISSDVVDRFSDVFTTNLLPELGSLLANRMQLELGPALDRVADGITKLEEGIRRLESGKQESLAGEVRQLTSTLQQSLTATLEQMGTQFRAALSGAAGQEFEQASSALRASADVLQGMNSSFESMQGAMARLLEESERRASRSFEENEGRTRSLNELVERLIVQMNDSATTSASEVQRLLVESVSGMGAKFSAFGAEMEDRIRVASQAGAQASERLVLEAANAAGRTSAETERLLARLGERSEDFVQAAGQLREMREGVERILAETGNKVRDLQDAATGFKSVAVEVSSVIRTLRETQDQQRKATEVSAGMVARVEAVVEGQMRVLTETRQTFEAAREILDGLDVRLGTALTVIVQQMQGYNTQVEQNFEKIMLKVNEKMPELFDRLEGGLQQVAESVEELQDTVSRISKGA